MSYRRQTARPRTWLIHVGGGIVDVDNTDATPVQSDTAAAVLNTVAKWCGHVMRRRLNRRRQHMVARIHRDGRLVLTFVKLNRQIYNTIRKVAKDSAFSPFNNNSRDTEQKPILHPPWR